MFEPTTNFNGSGGFGWNGFDGTAYAVSNATMTVNINSVNDAPVGTNGSVSINNASQHTFTTANF